MLKKYLHEIESSRFTRETGCVSQFYGMLVESQGPEAFVGERCEIFSSDTAVPVSAEVVGIKDNTVLLMPYGELFGIKVGSEVVSTSKPVTIPVSMSMLGRVIDAFGNPMDDKGDIKPDEFRPIYSPAVNPLYRPRITEVLETGVRSIDSLLTIGRGQRVGIFAGSGVGKSTLLGMIAKNMNADINVIALVGERGREVLDFIEINLGEEGLKRSVVVVATSDQPALVRSHAALTATTIAEYFRDQAKDVVLVMDSITRYAMAQREIGISVGEPPTARGYTPSVFAALPRLLERGGTSKSGGSITAFYTVLVEGDDFNDPISDTIRAILDGSVVLSRDLANQRHFPAIDILQSNSRLMPHLASPDELKIASDIAKIIDTYRNSKDMLDIGAYRAGTNKKLDVAIKLMPSIEEFLCQLHSDKSRRSDCIKKLSSILSNETRGIK